MSEPEINGTVYLLRSPSGKGYVGITNNFDRRMGEHKSRYSKDQTLIYNAIRKYGWGSFEKSVVASGIGTREALGEAEQFYIEKLDTLAPNGYNLASGGAYGGSPSAETRAKTSKTMKGRPKPDGFGDTMRKAKKGVPLSEGHKKALSKAVSKATTGVPKPWLVGVPRSEATRKKIKVGNLIRWMETRDAQWDECFR